MTDVPDDRLLEQFSRNGSEGAFAVLVQRHIALVHSVASRHTANTQHAQDITQAVFIILARKAGTLGQKTVLPGWLYHTARLTAANFQRAETSRVRREQEAFMQSKLEESMSDALWRELSPQLDEAMAGLGTSERDAVVLRYFQNKSMAEVGQLLGLTENTAQKRVGRALEKLRKFFTKRGVTLTAAVLTAAISANSVQAAPAGLAAVISATALSGTTIKTAAVIAATKALAMTTFQKIAVTAALTVTIGAGIYQAKKAADARAKMETLQQQQAPLAEQIEQLQKKYVDSTNRFANLLAENAQLKSSSNHRELLKLRGQLAVASQAAADATAKMQSLRTNSEPSELEALRTETRAHLNTFFKLANLPPDKADQYVNLEVEMQQRQDARMKGLLGGTLSVADASRQRDQDNQEQQDQRRELLGPDGWDTLQSIADGMRNNVAKNLTDTVQANMGDNPLTQQQSDQLQSAIKAEVAANTMDDTDLFRPVDEWTQMVTSHEQNVLQAASGFLTPSQLGTLQSLEGENLKLLLQKRELRLKALGINQ